jgi:hypothetical protein
MLWRSLLKAEQSDCLPVAWEQAILWRSLSKAEHSDWHCSAQISLTVCMCASMAYGAAKS